MSDLRNKYKATETDVLKNKIKDEDKSLNSSSRAGYISINDGANKLRIYPKHPGEDTFYQTRVVHWLTVEDDEGEEKRTTVFNSRIHGNTKLDIVEEYMRICKSKYEDSDDDSIEKLKLLTDWKGGLLPSTSWVCYAALMEKNKKGDTEMTFGEWEFKKAVRDGLNKIATVEDDDEPIEIDPFTDPETGYPIIYTFTPKKGKNKAKHDVVLSKKSFALTDEMLEEYDKVRPLSEIYRNNYSLVDFEKALAGLEFFDRQNEMNVFESEEFQDIIKKVKKQYASKKAATSVDDDEPKSSKKKAKTITNDDDDDEVKPVKKSSKKVAEVEEDEEEEVIVKKPKQSKLAAKLAEMDREELKEYISEEELGVVVKKSMEDEAIRKAILKEIEGAEEDDADLKPVKRPAIPTLDDIRKKMQKREVADDDDDDDDDE